MSRPNLELFALKRAALQKRLADKKLQSLRSYQLGFDGCNVSNQGGQGVCMTSGSTGTTMPLPAENYVINGNRAYMTDRELDMVMDFMRPERPVELPRKPNRSSSLKGYLPLGYSIPANQLFNPDRAPQSRPPKSATSAIKPPGSMPSGYPLPDYKLVNPKSVARVKDVPATPKPPTPCRPMACPHNVANPYLRIKSWIDADILILGPCVVSDRDYRILRRGGYSLRYEGVDIVPESVTSTSWWARLWRAVQDLTT